MPIGEKLLIFSGEFRFFKIQHRGWCKNPSTICGDRTLGAWRVPGGSWSTNVQNYVAQNADCEGSAIKKNSDRFYGDCSDSQTLA